MLTNYRNYNIIFLRLRFLKQEIATSTGYMHTDLQLRNGRKQGGNMEILSILVATIVAMYGGWIGQEYPTNTAFILGSVVYTTLWVVDAFVRNRIKKGWRWNDFPLLIFAVIFSFLLERAMPLHRLPFLEWKGMLFNCLFFVFVLIVQRFGADLWWSLKEVVRKHYSNLL